MSRVLSNWRFSLTPAFSRWERGPRSASHKKAGDGVCRTTFGINRNARCLIPLPAGEGQGGGERNDCSTSCRQFPVVISALLVSGIVSIAAGESPLQIATFVVDATPPVGSPLCHAHIPPAAQVADPLTARGLVLMIPKQKPIVLGAVDWVGNYNGGYDAWREALAQAAGTSIDRVTMHALHQHDAPGFDLTSEAILARHGAPGVECNIRHARQVVAAAAAALRDAMKKPEQVTHIGVGVGKVKQFASNRRILGPDGKVKFVRYSACRDAKIRAAPEGVIDPMVRVVSFWNHDKPVAVLSYYATHPQSHYGKGSVSADTVGLARSLREAALPGVFHMHFDGAGGNVAAGKYNDGSPGNRRALAERLAEGMAQAWQHAHKEPLSSTDIVWKVKPAALPLRDSLTNEAPFLNALNDPDATVRDKIRAARNLAWAQRCKAGHQCEISALWLGGIALLHMPGELFVEYQLAAHKLAPEAKVCLAAYADGGPGYIGTAEAYDQGGYETGVVSLVGPGVETVLMDAMREVLQE